VRVPELLRPTPPPTWRDRVETVVGTVRSAPGPSAVAAAAVVVAGLLGFVLVHKASPPPELRLPRAQPAPAAAPTTADVVVHVAGAVVHPGVARLPGGGRVTDAIAAAGGPTREADLDQVNLAARVSDGDRVYVPRRGEAPQAAVGGTTGSASATARPGPVDLNSAGVEQLDALPGVGPATAKAIVDYRMTKGRFRSVDDLLAVPGIGPAKLATLKPRVKV
jgi:competence protein ComEA